MITNESKLSQVDEILTRGNVDELKAYGVCGYCKHQFPKTRLTTIMVCGWSKTACPDCMPIKEAE